MKANVCIIALLSFSLSFSGCYTRSFVSKSEIDEHPGSTILEITTVKGDLVKFLGDKNGAAGIHDRNVIGKTTEGQLASIPLDDVKTFHIEEFSTAKTIWLVAGVGTVSGLLLALAYWGSKVVGTSN